MEGSQYLSDIISPMLSQIHDLLNTTALGRFITAIFLLIAGFVAGRALGKLTEIILKNVFDLDAFLKKINLSNALYGKKASEVAAGLVKWYIYMIFISEAARYVYLVGVSDWIRYVLPIIYYALLVFIFGLFVAEYVKNIILQFEIRYKENVATFSKYLIVYIFFVISLEKVGINVEIFYDILRYFMIAVSISFGVLVGLMVFKYYEKEIENLIRK